MDSSSAARSAALDHEFTGRGPRCLRCGDSRWVHEHGTSSAAQGHLSSSSGAGSVGRSGDTDGLLPEGLVSPPAPDSPAGRYGSAATTLTVGGVTPPLSLWIDGLTVSTNADRLRVILHVWKPNV